MVAAALSVAFICLLASIMACIHGVRYGCCGRESSCSFRCKVMSPLVLLGSGIYFFDFVTDANFYVTLSRREKSSALGYACLASLAASALS